MKILGISAFYHDSAAVLIEGDEIIAAAQEERFTRVKHDASFPQNAIEYCLKEAGLEVGQLDAVVFYDKPFLKFERIIQTLVETAPRGWWQFVKSMPAWLTQKLFIKDEIKKALKEIGKVNWKQTDLLFSKHHFSHAASAFYPSAFEEAAILTIDGVGEFATASIAHGKGKSIKTLKEMNFPNSVGLLYSAFTYYLGFKVNSGEYKVMGLAPYAKKDDPLVLEYKDKLKNIVHLHNDGSIELQQEYFSYTHSFKMIATSKMEKLFGLKRRDEESAIAHEHCCMAMALQMVTEEIVLKMAQHAKDLTGCKKLCMAGGVALNCVSNGLLLEAGIFDEIYVQPAAGDAGNALGAAFAAYHMHYQKERNLSKDYDNMKWSRLGPSYSKLAIERSIESFNVTAEYLSDKELIQGVGRELQLGKTVAWFQGRMEFGPRALGGRSILGNPLLTETQSMLNLKVKQRESFRPFAPIMLQEELDHYFGRKEVSPYMLFVHKLKEEFRLDIKSDNQDLITKINQKRSDLPAITHMDYSARIQTVTKESDGKMHDLLQEFKRLTGVGVLVNTSFNLRGEPIVCSPKDALATFLSTEIDYLVLGNNLISREKNLDLIGTYVQTKLD